MLTLRDETDELGDYVAQMKDKRKRLLYWKELNAVGTVPDFS